MKIKYFILVLFLCSMPLSIALSWSGGCSVKSSGNLTGGGTANYLSLWTGTKILGNANLFQSGNNILPTSASISLGNSTNLFDYIFGTHGRFIKTSSFCSGGEWTCDFSTQELCESVSLCTWSDGSCSGGFDCAAQSDAVCNAINAYNEYCTLTSVTSGDVTTIDMNATYVRATNMMYLQQITLQTCESTIIGWIGRNATGVYYCNSTNWKPVVLN